MSGEANLNESQDNSSNLDEILDDALQDFKSVNSLNDESTAKLDEKLPHMWAEEFTAAAASKSHSTVENDIRNGEVDALPADFVNVAEAAAKIASGNNPSEKDLNQALVEAMEFLNANHDNQGAPTNEAEFEEFFSKFSNENLSSDEGGLGSFFPLMQTMVENILSKDILYPPLKEMVNKFPEWLATNREQLSESEFNRFNKQYDIMKQIVTEFEKDHSDKDTSQDAASVDSILVLMQKLQELGHPPTELLGSIESSGPEGAETPREIADLTALLNQFSFPNLNQSGNETTNQGQSNEEKCTVM